MKYASLTLLFISLTYSSISYSNDVNAEELELRGWLEEFINTGKNATACGVERVELDVWEGVHGCKKTPTQDYDPLSAEQGICTTPAKKTHHKLYKRTSSKYCPEDFKESGWPSRFCNSGGELLHPRSYHETNTGSRSCLLLRKYKKVHVRCGTPVWPINNECHHLGFGIDESAYATNIMENPITPEKVKAAAKLLKTYENKIRTNPDIHTIEGEDIVSLATYTSRNTNDVKLSIDDLMYRSLLLSVEQDNFIEACKKTQEYIESLPDFHIITFEILGKLLNKYGFKIQ